MYKYIDILQTDNSDAVNIDFLNSIIEKKKMFRNNNIQFYFLIVGKVNNKKKNELYLIQEKFGIIIGIISLVTLQEIFNLSDCKCGFSFLLDNKNKVRYANRAIVSDMMNEIINSELQKKFY